MSDQVTRTKPKPVEVSAAAILGLALPALGVLAATPLYLLLDTAVVGRLGTVALAALGAGTTLYSMVTTQLTFLSYGTTARASRKFGAGDTSGAIAEGVQATWLALIVGSVLTCIMFLGAPSFTLWLAHDPDVAATATTWLRVTAFGIPLLLMVMAGNGWLRGIQNTRLPLIFTLAGIVPGAVLVPLLVHHFGVVGSAWANLIGTTITASCFLGCLFRRHEGNIRPQPTVMVRQLVLGRDLILRSLSFQVAFLSAASVAARFGPDSLAAHQVLLQLWNFLALVLDSLAIAAQALTGAALGAGSVALARATGQKLLAYSTGFAAALALVFAIGHSWIPTLFTQADAVLSTIAGPWWQLILLILLGGVVFALDGVLLGASDAAFLRTASIASVVFGFLPGVWLSLAFGGGLVGVWWGIVAFISIRLVAGVWRFYSMRWAKIDTSET
ncbi:MATE family efflux transporter [Corynebacterium gerontici]|uniref:DNA-damage-inducible protein F n=1 Tax=Corynebacterium gerontici TaxID=2079234 RepID=A0A3G6J1E9_9CORY|nr:MATE family efflux transporter [Corynebacterium gerontici]AZA11633.1 DNA-damage-inducible protein F [Corynebacterium gerontici]